MTSGNLQRWILPFSWNLNMKEDCETHQGTWNAGVEYCSICISLEFGSLNDVVGNIKSSIALRALIWIVKATLVVKTIQQRKMDITHAKLWETYQCIFAYSYERFQLRSAISFKVKKQLLHQAQTHAVRMKCVKVYFIQAVRRMHLIYRSFPWNTRGTQFHHANEM